MPTANNPSSSPISQNEQQREKAPGTALAALILGICSFLPGIGILAGIAAIILGIITINQLANGPKKGKGQAVAGIILGILGIAMHVIIISLIATLAKDMMEDPASMLRNLPGTQQGCNAEKPFTCEDYTITGSAAELTLSTINEATITKIEGVIFKEGMRMEDFSSTGEALLCTWEGTATIETGGQQAFNLACQETIGEEDVLVFVIDYQDEIIAGTIQQAGGMIIS